jgi:hypothetical protein
MINFSFNITTADGKPVDPRKLDEAQRALLFNEAKKFTAALRPDPWSVVRGNVVVTPGGEELNLVGAQLKFFKQGLLSLNLTDSVAIPVSDLDVTSVSNVQRNIANEVNDKHCALAVAQRDGVIYASGHVRNEGELYVKPVNLAVYNETVQVRESKVTVKVQAGHLLYKIGRTGQGEEKRATQQKLSLGAGKVISVSRHDESTMETDMNNSKARDDFDQ